MNEIKKININGTEYSLNVDVIEGYLSSGNFYKLGQVPVDYVEIGGLKWATKNIGASSVTDTGLYFQWGDTQGYTAAQVGSGSGKKAFNWADYKYGNGTSNPGNTGMTKYNSTDGKTVLDASDDAVTAAWGGSWRMPTTEEYAALDNAVNTAWTANYQGSGVAGLVLTDKTDSSKVLFFPAAGYCYNGSVYYVGGNGSYWSSSVDSSNVQYAYYLYFDNSSVYWQRYSRRSNGFAVRGVWDGEGTPTIPGYVQVTPEQNKLYIDTTTNKIYRHDGSSYVEVSSAPTSLPASDVYNWAKAASKPSYTLDEVSDGSTRKLSDYPKKTIEITWASLKSARDNSQLVPGQWYRITDYHTTTTQENTLSAGHQFDVIVRADAVNVLNENAYAAKHAGDTYFTNAGAKLEAWELKYCIDNINWSLAPSGEKITFIGPSGLTSAEYDGIVTSGSTTYYKWKLAQSIYSFSYVFSTSKSSNAIIYFDAYGNFADSGFKISENIPASTSEGFGTIIWMKDEFNNECHYDFKNIQFKRWKATDAKQRNYIHDKYMAIFNLEMPKDISISDMDDFIWAFTFSSNNSGDVQTDTSLSGGVYNNVFVKLGKILSNNVLYGTNSYGNKFGNGFQYNSIGNNFSRNSIGNDSQYNSIGNNFRCNSIGNNFSNNSIGNDSQYNSIGNNFSNNSIGNSFSRNSIGNNFSNNSIGNSFYNNSIGNDSQYNSIGNYSQYSSIGNNCQFIRIQKDYVYYVIIENGNQYIDITSTQTTSSSNALRNFTIAQGVNNTSTSKTISHNSVSDTFKTTYQPQNSLVISV